MHTRRRAHRARSFGVVLAGVTIVAVFGGVASVLASTVPRAQLVLAEQGGAATIVASEWTGSGACAGAAVRAGKELTGTASLESAAGGAAEMVLQMHSKSGSYTFTGSVGQANGTDITIDVRTSVTGGAYTANVTGSGTRFVGPLTASANGCTITSTGTLTLAGAGLTETTTTTTTISTTGLSDLGGLSVAGYCQQTEHASISLAKGGSIGPGFAYDNWQCGSGPPLVMQTLCVWTYSAQATGVVAVATDANDAESWQCYGLATAATSTTTTSTTIAQGAGSSHGSSETNPAVAPIASSIGTPGEVFHSPGHDLVVALVAVGVMLFIAFPANIFNHTFQENYEEILEMVANARRRVRAAVGLRVRDPERDAAAAATDASAPQKSGSALFVVTLVLGAILGGLLKPGFGFNASSFEDFLAALFAFAFGATVSWFIARAFRRHHRYVHHTYLRALPLGILIAAVCVVISRLSDFSPGYLYGIVVSIAWVESLTDRHNAHLTAISALSTLGVAVTAWLLWIPANHLALQPGSNGLEVLIDDTLGSIFIGGLVGTVVSLLPLSGLPGGTLLGWRRDAWAAVCFLSLFLLIEVELLPASGPTHPGGAPIVTAVVLFILFGGLSFGMREFFERRHRAAEPSVPELATSAPTPESTAPPDAPA